MINFENYSDATQIFMNSVADYLLKTYDEISESWQIALFFLAENIEMYLKCKDELKLTGIFNKKTGRKNPLLSTMKDLQTVILKQIQNFGLSPYAASRIKIVSEDDTVDFIEMLTN